MPFELTIHERDGPARRQVLPRKILFFGRREDNDVVFPFTFVSSRHGRLFLRDGSVFVEDMGSTNGTLVNGEPLTPMIARALQPEDRVQIERIAIQVRWSEEAATGAAESVTYHEMPRPTALAPGRTAAAPPALPRPAPPPPASTAPERTIALPPNPPAPEPTLAPLPLPPAAPGPAPAPDLPVVRPEVPSPRSDLEKAAHLGQPSFSDALATRRPPPPTESAERDRYLAWEIFFKTVGLVAILGGIVLLVFVLVA
jgi:pSer/pThr/pTyr-binding forkhead associated (FHA) protein